MLDEHHKKGTETSQLDDDLQDARGTDLELIQQSRHAHVDVGVNNEVSAQPIASSLVRV